jgi:hypothetical protein
VTSFQCRQRLESDRCRAAGRSRSLRSGASASRNTSPSSCTSI